MIKQLKDSYNVRFFIRDNSYRNQILCDIQKNTTEINIKILSASKNKEEYKDNLIKCLRTCVGLWNEKSNKFIYINEYDEKTLLSIISSEKCLVVKDMKYVQYFTELEVKNNEIRYLEAEKKNV